MRYELNFYVLHRRKMLKISPCTNVTLILGWITLFIGDMGEGVLNRDQGELAYIVRRNIT
jgi:hypothetical protein